jgi:hypothetical protein
MFLLTVVLPVVVTAVLITVFSFNKGFRLLEPLLCPDGTSITWEDGDPTEYYMDGEWHTSVETFIYCASPNGPPGNDIALVSFIIYLLLSIIPALLLVGGYSLFQKWFYKHQYQKYQGGG